MKVENSQVQENTIKSIRITHGIIITICITTLVFLFSPIQYSKYSGAVEEINTLINLPINKIVFYRAIKEDSPKIIFNKIKTLLENHGLKYSPSGDNDFVSASIKGYVIPNHDLETIDTFFNSDHEMSVSYKLIEHDNEKEIESKISDKLEELLKIDPNINEVSFDITGKTIWFHAGVAQTPETLIYINIEDELKTQKMAININLLQEINKYHQWSSLVKERGGSYFVTDHRVSTDCGE